MKINWNKKIVIGLLIILLVSIFLEGVVFNINSFRLLGGEYPYKKIEISDDILEGLENLGDNRYKVTKNNPMIRIKDVNIQTGTIKLDISREHKNNQIGKRKTDITIYYSDATSKYLRKTPTKTINEQIARSQFGILHLSGKTNSIVIQIKAEKDEIINLKDIEFNVSVPYKFNFARFSMVFLIITALYLFFNLKIFDEEYDARNKYHSTVVIIVLLTYIITMVSTTILESDNKNIVTDLDTTRTIVYEKYYTDSLINGSLSLQVEKDARLDEMDNVYDETARSMENINYLYDYAYYDGNYYVYFSILPQLLVNIPFRLITGQYINVAYEVLLFALLGTVFTLLAIEKLIKKFFKNVNLRMMTLSMITALFSSVLLYLTVRTLVYEVVASCGYWLIMQAVYFLACAFDKEKINYKCLTIGCISAALAVNARPNLLIVSLLFLPIFIEKFVEFIKKLKNDNSKTTKKEFVKYILAIVLPYGIIGISMMILNYVRFGSITEFGAAYQLTSNDMINLGYRYSTIPIGIWHYLFNPPVINLTFPFIHMQPVTPLYLGFYGCGYVGVGTFWATPITLLLIFIPILRKHIKNTNVKLWRLIRNSLIVALIMIIVITLLAASYERYSLDYTWMVVWPAIAMMLLIYDLIKENELVRKMFEIVCTIATIICICVAMAMAIKSESRYAEYFSSEQYDNISQSMMFWE